MPFNEPEFFRGSPTERMYMRGMAFLRQATAQYSVHAASFGALEWLKVMKNGAPAPVVVDPRKRQSQAHLHHGASNASSQRSAASMPSRFRFDRARRTRYLPR